MGANFTPSLDGYSGQGTFRYWCQKVLPIVYDDSLSYMELLDKVINYLNNTISDVASVEENVRKLNEAYVKLQDYVNQYFDELDVNTEIENKLDKMVQDGTLDDIISPIIPALVTTWLNTNVNPVGSAVIVDKTLSITGAAADAKRVGYFIDMIVKRFGINFQFPDSDLTSGTINDQGQVSPNPERAYSEIINITANSDIYPAKNMTIVVFAYDSDGNFVSRLTTQTNKYSATAGQRLKIMCVKQDGEFIVENSKAIGSRFCFYVMPKSSDISIEDYTCFGSDYMGNSTAIYETTSPNIIYNLYDNLMEQFPRRISKKLLGMDESNTFPVYCYTITPPPSSVIDQSTGTIISNKGDALKTALLTSGTHGNGTDGDNNEGILALYHVIERILKNSNYIEQTLSMNTVLKVVPCVNPWGVANNSRYNSRNVDINRNFQYGWIASEHSGANYYSECESRYIRDLMAEGASIHIEIHSRGGNTQTQSGVPLLSLTVNNTPMLKVLKTSGGITKDKTSNYVSQNAEIHVGLRDYGQMDGTSYHIYHIPSCLIECAFWIDSIHSAVTDMVNTIQVGNTLYYMLKI